MPRRNANVRSRNSSRAAQRVTGSRRKKAERLRQRNQSGD